jgi:hypothetical protein
VYITYICVCVCVYIYIYTTFSFLTIVQDRGTLWHLPKFFQYIKYVILKFIPSSLLPYHPHPLFLEQLQGVSFLHLHTCVLSIHTIFTLPLHFPTSSPSHWYQPPRQDVFCPPVLQFCKRKKMTFLFKITTQGVSL